MTDLDTIPTHDEKKSSTKSTLMEFFDFQINLPNKGSVARDHVCGTFITTETQLPELY